MKTAGLQVEQHVRIACVGYGFGQISKRFKKKKGKSSGGPPEGMEFEPMEAVSPCCLGLSNERHTMPSDAQSSQTEATLRLRRVGSITSVVKL